MEHPTFYNLRNIEVSKLDSPIFSEEDVGTFDVSVDNLEVVESLKASEDLYEVRPALILGQCLSTLLKVVDLLQEVPTIGMLHNYTERRGGVFKEGLLV